MNVVVIGDFPEKTKKNIAQTFPAGWKLRIGRLGEVDSFLSDADVVIPEHVRIDAPFLDRTPNLRMVQTGAGYDNVKLDECTKRGVLVCNAAGINAAAVAEHVMALILCWYKNIAYLDAFLKSHRNERELDYAGAELAGKTMGIIGLGNAGKRVAAFGRAFDMNILGYSHKPVDIQGVKQVHLDRLYEESDVVTIHVPLLPSTRHMINSDAFSKMKPDALLVNTARGAIVEKAALLEALRKHKIGGACLDVYEEEPLAENDPLRDLPNVLLTPHTAGLPDGVKYHKKRYEFFVKNITKLTLGEKPDFALNMAPDGSFFVR